jgi:hypothetical protein
LSEATKKRSTSPRRRQTQCCCRRRPSHPTFGTKTKTIRKVVKHRKTNKISQKTEFSFIIIKKKNFIGMLKERTDYDKETTTAQATSMSDL